MRRFTVYDAGRQQYLSLRFRVFGRLEARYALLKTVDTTLAVRFPKGRGGRRKFAEDVDGALSALIAGVLRMSGTGTTAVFTRDAIPFVDQSLKKHLPLYEADVYPDGVYLTFNSFLRLRPEYTRFLLLDSAAPMQSDFLLVATHDDPSLRVNPEQIYAFVFKGKAYVTFDGKFKALSKTDGEYYLTGKVRVDAPGVDMAVDMASFVAAAASLARLPFVQVWGLSVKKKFVCQLDYWTGRFVPVRPAE